LNALKQGSGHIGVHYQVVQYSHKGITFTRLRIVIAEVTLITTEARMMRDIGTGIPYNAANPNRI